MTVRHAVISAVIASAAITGSASTGSARAAVFDFSYSFPTSDTTDFPSGQTSASGAFTAADQMDGSFLVTDVSGSWNGEAITGVSALNTEGENDNLIYPTSTPVLDLYGVTFSVAGPIAGDRGSGVVSVYYEGGYTDASFATGNSKTFHLSAAPEPSAWALMIVGFALLGAGLRRQPHRPSAFATA